MKTKSRKLNRGWPLLLACVLALALAAAPALAVSSGLRTAPTDAAPTAFQPEQLCTLTVKFPEQKEDHVWDLQAQDTVVDLYRVASAVPLAGFDVYAYCVDDTQPWYDLIKDYVTADARAADWKSQVLDAAPYADATDDTAGAASEWLLFRYAPDDPEKATVSDWEALEEILADALFGPKAVATPVEPGATAPSGAPNPIVPVRTQIDVAAEGLQPGLYLHVVHGDIPQYTVGKAMKDAPDDALHLRTIAYTDTQIYTFRPQLISLPGLGADVNGRPITNTADGNGWLYDVTAVCKAEEDPRFASLEVQKTLTTYAAPVTFVFRVVARDPDAAPDAAPLYETVLPLSFAGPGSQATARLDNCIPVGSTVTVTEEYGGAMYTLTDRDVTVRANPNGAATAYPGAQIAPGGRAVVIPNIQAGTIGITTPVGQVTTLEVGSTITAAFTNDTTPTPNGGGSVVNTFEPDAAGGWTWHRRAYNAETGEWETQTPPEEQPDRP